MAAPKFSFTGWNSQTLAPKVPVTASVEGAAGGFSMPKAPMSATAVTTPGLAAPANATGALAGTIPAWLQAEIDKLNAAQALRTQLTGQVTGGAPAPSQNIGDLLQGVAAVTAARSGFNTSMNQINEQARLQNLVQQRSQLQPTGGFGFNDPLQVPRMLDLDRQISGYQNVNLPLAAASAGGRSSGWTSPYVNPFRTF